MAKSEYDIQAENFLNKNGIRIIKKFLDKKPPQWDTSSGMHNHYEIIVSRKNSTFKEFSFEFWDSINNTEKGETPSDYDILATLSNDSNQYSDFKEFCEELGYNIDSRKDYRTWEQALEFAEKINKFFTPNEIEELQEIR